MNTHTPGVNTNTPGVKKDTAAKSLLTLSVFIYLSGFLPVTGQMVVRGVTGGDVAAGLGRNQ